MLSDIFLLHADICIIFIMPPSFTLLLDFWHFESTPVDASPPHPKILKNVQGTVNLRSLFHLLPCWLACFFLYLYDLLVAPPCPFSRCNFLLLPALLLQQAKGWGHEKLKQVKKQSKIKTHFYIYHAPLILYTHTHKHTAQGQPRLCTAISSFPCPFPLLLLFRIHHTQSIFINTPTHIHKQEQKKIKVNIGSRSSSHCRILHPS